MIEKVGKVSQIIGPVVDVSFDTSTTELPNIYDSLEVTKEDGSNLVLEVQSHVGEDMVRTISMDSTDGLQRGQDVVSTGSPIQMPTGKEIYGETYFEQVISKLNNKEISELIQNLSDKV